MHTRVSFRGTGALGTMTYKCSAMSRNLRVLKSINVRKTARLGAVRMCSRVHSTAGAGGRKEIIPRLDHQLPLGFYVSCIDVVAPSLRPSRKSRANQRCHNTRAPLSKRCLRENISKRGNTQSACHA